MRELDPLLTIQEVSAILRISRSSIYRRVKDGQIPAPRKLGSLSRWPRSAIARITESWSLEDEHPECSSLKQDLYHRTGHPGGAL